MGVLRLQPKGVVGFGEVALDVEGVIAEKPGILLHRGRWSLEIPKNFDEEHLRRVLAVLGSQACS